MEDLFKLAELSATVYYAIDNSKMVEGGGTLYCRLGFERLKKEKRDGKRQEGRGKRGKGKRGKRGAEAKRKKTTATTPRTAIARKP